jgi:hypothetical protein
MKNLKNYINESFLNSCVKKYEKDIYKYLETRKWDDLYDILQEYGYGDEYYDLVDEVLNNLNVDEKHKDYEDLRYGLQNAIKTYLVKNKMWK